MPVEVCEREIWQVGPHRLACLDLEQTRDLAFWPQLGSPQILYTDPPWNAGVAQVFRTKSGRPGKAAIDMIWEGIADIVDALRIPTLFVEQSIDPKQRRWDGVAEAHDLPVHHVYTVTYGSPPISSLVWTGGSVPPPQVDLAGSRGGDAMVAQLLGPYKGTGAVVADTCVGLGTTARVCHRLGLTLLASEFDPKRLARTIDWLVKATGEQAVRA